ncbi:MAG: NYN domain-containing protein [Gemmatimonadetes bacterium]|nr:NYN domain-containing protein [Gemmatimonadota bacterium]
MNARSPRHAVPRAPIAPLHRGPQALPPSSATATYGSPIQHAPNAALLIDFDNVTMGIRSDLAGELRSLLSSDIIKGKVAVQRAYADWRRYPQYIVPLAESSIDMIMAPAYGSSKKNATDIRLAVDAIELVFTRPEIGTYILLSGDSDFASLVTKLKEYGKYVIGVGIRESSSDLLVMNCDEYYSYNALAGLVKSSEEDVQKWDPWELVVEAIGRMKKNGDVMRSDRLKQVMQDIDATFDEKNYGYSKFSKFVSDAAEKGLVTITKLENGQLEVGPSPRAETPRHERAERHARPDRPERPERHDRRHEPRVDAPRAEAPRAEAPRTEAPRADAARVEGGDEIGRSGERLTRQEAFDLVKRSATALVTGDAAVPARAMRTKAFELLGRDSESLSERMFERILKDAHDQELIDLRRRGNDFEVSLPAAVAPVSEQLNRAAAAHAAAVAAAAPPAAPPAPRGMVPRGAPPRGGRGRAPVGPPPELLLVGVVEDVPTVAATAPAPITAPNEVAPHAPKGRGAPKAKGAKPAAKEAAKPKPPAKAAKPAKAESAPAKGAARGGRGGKAKKPAAK